MPRGRETVSLATSICHRLPEGGVGYQIFKAKSPSPCLSPFPRLKYVKFKKGEIKNEIFFSEKSRPDPNARNATSQIQSTTPETRNLKPMNDQMFAAIDCWDAENPCGVCRWCHPDYCGFCNHIGCLEADGHPNNAPPPHVEEKVILFFFFVGLTTSSLFSRTPYACGVRVTPAPRRSKATTWCGNTSSPVYLV